MPDGAPDERGAPTRPRLAQCTCYLKSPFLHHRHHPDCPRYDANSRPGVSKEHLLRLYERLALVEAALAFYADEATYHGHRPPIIPDRGRRARATLAAAHGWPPKAEDGTEAYGHREGEGGSTTDRTGTTGQAPGRPPG